MEILASCSYEESKNLDGKLIFQGSDGIKIDKVSLNIVVSNGDVDISKYFSSNVKCVTYTGDVDLSGINTMYLKRVFREVDMSFNSDNIGNFDYERFHSEGVVTLLRVNDSFSDMRVLKFVCEKYPFIRIIGGNLLNIEGVRIGRYDLGKDSDFVVYNGIYDQFLEMQLSELGNLNGVIKRIDRHLDRLNPKSKGAGNGEKKKASVRQGDIVKSFSTLFGGIEGEEF